MYSYNVFEWIVFFAIYCLIGWAGESLYVSWEHKKWVNRGFLHGPFLPIYGSGAIIILFATLPVRHNLFLVFLFGMTSATVLEYITGYVMEQIFKVRYWDYTIQPFNLNGYICLGCSIAWGVCAELLINFIHKPVERFVVSMDENVISVCAILFCVYFCTDLSLSTKEAFDLRRLILDAIESNEHLRRIEKRMDVIIAFAEDDKERFKAKIEKYKDENEKRKLSFAFDLAEAKLEFYDKLEAKKSEYEEEVSKLKNEIKEAREKYVARMKQAKEKSASSILKRNPGANANKAKLNLEELLKHIKSE